MQVEGAVTQTLSAGWQAASAPARDGETEDLERLSWLAASVPGTAAGALRDAGLWQVGEPHDFDQEDWWFRTGFDAEPVAAGEEVTLHLGGIATVAEAYLNGELVLESDSMFASHALAVGERLRDRNELAIRCRALSPLLAEPRRPRARWPTRLVPERNLRFFRTMLLGRAPGFAPGPPAVGPWRPVSLRRDRRLAVRELTLRPRIEGQAGVLAIAVGLRLLEGQRLSSVAVELDGPSGTHRAQLALSGPDEAPSARGELTVPEVARWWPHTHGHPQLYDVRVLVADAHRQIAIDAGRIGFRELAFGAGPTVHELERDGLDLHVNGVRVFARGAVWTPIDAVGMAPSEPELRAALARVRDAGMNMVRLPGTSAYETNAFHDLCDELGILVWQDFMFANFDYPIAHEPFRASVAREARGVLDDVGGRPSLAVLCGNSEVEQQVAMLGLDPTLGRGELFGELLPDLVRASGVDALYVPSAPCGGELPFRPDRGIANYYGVGGYRRPLDDARRAGVRFAAECLAFSNLPSYASAQENPLSRTGVPRDVGADWDFADVRDHYLGLLFDLDARALASADAERYLELSRAVTGEVMAEVFGEWRRAGSPCGGGLVLWLQDLLPGAGWGVVDHRGIPKLAYHHLKRALAPVAVWTVDEGLGGIVAHVANDRPQPLSAKLRVALYSGGDRRVEEAVAPVELAGHSQREWNVETVIGHFVDAAWAYRFGPPAQDAIVVSLERDGDRGHDGAGRDQRDGDRDDSEVGGWGDSQIISQAVRFPAGRPLEREAPERLGLAVEAVTPPGGETRLALTSERLAYGVRIDAPGFLASDDGFSIEPGGTRSVSLQPIGPTSALERARVLALNMEGHLRIAAREPAR